METYALDFEEAQFSPKCKFRNHVLEVTRDELIPRADVAAPPPGGAGRIATKNTKRHEDNSAFTLCVFLCFLWQPILPEFPCLHLAGSMKRLGCSCCDECERLWPDCFGRPVSRRKISIYFLGIEDAESVRCYIVVVADSNRTYLGTDTRGRQ